MADFKDYYKIIGVSRNASEKEIKQAYRKLARKYHPDANPNGDAAAKKFKEINEANDVLSDAEKRRKYDAFGLSGIEGASYQAGSSVFGMDSFFPPGWYNPQATTWNQTSYAKQNPVVNQATKTGNTETTAPNSYEEISLPVNDLGLLRALILVNQTDDDGVWRIRRSAKDTRTKSEKEHVPLSDLVYEVRKENGIITVGRSVDDWRRRDDREKRIIHVRSNETFEPKDFIPETRLFSGELDVSNIRIPANLISYLGHLKGLAKKMARGGDWQKNTNLEIDGVNRYLTAYRGRLRDFQDPIERIPLENLDMRVKEEIVLRDINPMREGDKAIQFGAEGRV